ncbi:hypothetical protein N7540_007255 [Penicillium herquei]|nr:hypothetical protein N7540_007255 [Penicillium herquei]
MVILPDKRNVSASSDQMSYWKSNPETKQLEEIRFSLEKLVQEPSAKVNNYESDEETTNRMEMFSFVGTLFHQPLSHGVQKAAARVALVISNLEPWEVLPATPEHISKALCSVLRTQVKNGNGQESLHNTLETQRHIPPGWTRKGLTDALNDIPSIKRQFFSKSSHKCSIYHTSMKAVFREANLSQNRNAQRSPRFVYRGRQQVTIDKEKLVRLKLAAVISSNVLTKETGGDHVEEIFGRLCGIHGLTEVPLPQPLDDTLVDIYATYLYGWFGDATKAESGWRETYQRRVFIE